MLNVKPTIKIVATLLAKNESDIIGLNIEHHINHGVSQFIVTDNASSDNTRQIVEKYPEVVEIIDEPGNDHHQSKWVTRMARLACKLNPDWIVHLDADELWCNLHQLRTIKSDIAGCERMYLHPPISEKFDLSKQRYYLNFDQCEIPQECKIAHRPNRDIEISHGNHGVVNGNIEFTKSVFRHHYPIRSYSQWESKAKGHEALSRRNAPCERWRKWHKMLSENKLRQEYDKLICLWGASISDLTHAKFIELLDFWATPEMVKFFQESLILPEIGEWPLC